MLAFTGIGKTTYGLPVLQTHPDRRGFIDPLQFLVHEMGKPSPSPTPQGFDRIDFSRHIGPFVFGQQQIPAGGCLAPRFQNLIEPRASRRGEIGKGLHFKSIGFAPPASSSGRSPTVLPLQAVRTMTPKPDQRRPV